MSSGKSFNPEDLKGATLNGEEILIYGQWQHPQKGKHVEKSLIGEKSRSSVSIWKLAFPDYETALRIFDNLFCLTPEEALRRDTLKGVYAKLNIMETSLEDIPEKDLIAEDPETIFISREENPEIYEEEYAIA